MRLLVSTRNASIKMTTVKTCYRSCCGDCDDGGVGGGGSGDGGGDNADADVAASDDDDDVSYDDDGADCDEPHQAASNTARKRSGGGRS